ncbi:MAG: trypsin-like peptidase domain-containing protein [Anaerolineales bacterium]|nr:trypsin-like peptidase domain-containing protein [Anaerolineales bacterium]
MMSFETGVVAILGKADQIVGTGFVVTDRLILTCKHVVTESKGTLDSHITVRFRFPNQLNQVTSVKYIYNEEDVAVLELKEPLPTSVSPIKLASSSGLAECPFRTFGFPANFDKINGVWGRGSIEGRVDEIGLELLQLTSSQVTRGFSGAPVWISGLGQGGAVGMISKISKPDEYSRNQYTCFAISSEALIKLIKDTHLEIIRLSLKSPRKSSVPPLISNFVGRSGIIDRLKNWLFNFDETKKVGLVVGMGGIGKTTLLIYLAHQLKNSFADGVIFLNAQAGTKVNQRILIEDYQVENIGDQDLARTVRKVFRDKDTLILIDEVEKSDQVLEILELTGTCPVIISSRKRIIAAARDATVFELRPFTLDDSLKLFSNILKRDFSGQDDSDLTEISELLGYLPLAINLSGCWLKNDRTLTISDFIEFLKNEKKRLEELDYENVSLKSVFYKSYNQLQLDQQEFLKALVVLGTNDFNFEAAAFIANVDFLTAKKNLGVLYRESLIEIAAEKPITRFRLHSLIRDFVSDLFEDKTLYFHRMVDYFRDYGLKHSADSKNIYLEINNIRTAFEIALNIQILHAHLKDLALLLLPFLGNVEESVLFKAPSIRTLITPLRAEMAIGSMNYRRKNFNQAIEKFENVLDDISRTILENHDHENELMLLKSMCLYNLGLAQSDLAHVSLSANVSRDEVLSLFCQSKENYQEGLALAQNLDPFEDRIIWFYLQLAKQKIQQADLYKYPENLQSYQEAIAIVQFYAKTRYKKRLGLHLRSYINYYLGLCYHCIAFENMQQQKKKNRANKDLKKAHDYYVEAKILNEDPANSVFDMSHRAEILANLAEVTFKIGEVARAKMYVEEAKTIISEWNIQYLSDFINSLEKI